MDDPIKISFMMSESMSLVMLALLKQGSWTYTDKGAHDPRDDEIIRIVAQAVIAARARVHES